jgi:ankyrin repeat protein
MRTVITVGALISLAGCYLGPARSPLVRAASGSDLAEVEQLLGKGADPNVCHAPEGVTELSPLAAAAAGGNVEVAVALLRGGARVDARCGGKRPLDLAVANGHQSVVAVLIAAGADPAARTDGGWTYLMQAAIDVQPGVVPILASKGCPLEATRPRVPESPDDRAGVTALMMAAGWDPRPTRALIAAGANVNARDALGDTPLIHAIKGAVWTAENGATAPGKWDPSIVRMLLDAGADPNLAGSSGHRAIDLASRAGSNAAVIHEMLSKPHT